MLGRGVSVRGHTKFCTRQKDPTLHKNRKLQLEVKCWGNNQDIMILFKYVFM